MKTQLRIEAQSTVDATAPAADDVRMPGMVRHVDGAILIQTRRFGLFRSTDEGRTWQHLPVELPEAPPDQGLLGIGATGDGRLWLLHQGPPEELFVSSSSDVGESWSTTCIDFADLAPEDAPRRYRLSYNDYNTFAELPDGTLLVSAGMSYGDGENIGSRDPANLTDGLLRPDADIGGETVLRSTDGGATWGDPTRLFPFTCEVGHAVDPKDANHLLAMTRIQRALLAGEDFDAAVRKTGCRPDTPPTQAVIYKNGLLVESFDGGRTYHEVPGALTGYYEHRGTVLWTADGTVLVTHQGGDPAARAPDGRLLVRLSLDGGRTWVDGAGGTQRFNESTKLELVPADPGHSFTSPTVELGDGRFLTVYVCGEPLETRVVRWRLQVALPVVPVSLWVLSPRL